MKYVDRNGNKIVDDSSQDKLLHLLYTHMWGRVLLKPLVTPGFSGFAGRLLNTKLSTCLIPKFIKNNHIDMSCYQETEYRSFNDFFSRKIKPGARIFSPKETDLISPCDCYASAYRIDPALLVNIKDTTYSVASLLRSKNWQPVIPAVHFLSYGLRSEIITGIIIRFPVSSQKTTLFRESSTR